MKPRPTLSVASRSNILTKSTFSGYDCCINSYVGCQFGCTYCYVRFFVKDDNEEWGDFVRVREHMDDKLPKELRKGFVKIAEGRRKLYNEDGTPDLDENGKHKSRPNYRRIPIPETRLVLGTMTDPYQPIERKHRITRTALQKLLESDAPQFQKVGIFTRSPIVLEDLDLIKQLPKARVHYTITPFHKDVLRAIEPVSPVTARRWEVVEKLKDAGIRVHCNISPVMPLISEGFAEEFTKKLCELQIDEYFVDPMQPYKESFEAFQRACQGLKGVDWPTIQKTMTDKERYLDWKMDFFQDWEEHRKVHQHKAPNQMPIWCDHENKVWVNMLTGEQMDSRRYGEEA
jgi:DNA repair photolyase